MESKIVVTPLLKALLSLFHLLLVLHLIFICLIISSSVINSDKLFIKLLWQETGQLSIQDKNHTQLVL